MDPSSNGQNETPTTFHLAPRSSDRLGSDRICSLSIPGRVRLAVRGDLRGVEAVHLRLQLLNHVAFMSEGPPLAVKVRDQSIGRTFSLCGTGSQAG